MSMEIKNAQKQGPRGCNVSTRFNLAMGTLSVLAGGVLIWLVYAWL